MKHLLLPRLALFGLLPLCRAASLAFFDWAAWPIGWLFRPQRLRGHDGPNRILRRRAHVRKQGDGSLELLRTFEFSRTFQPSRTAGEIVRGWGILQLGPLRAGR